MATLQVREIDDGLYSILKKRAKAEHRSLSQEVVKILESFVQQPDKNNQDATADFLSLCGSWQDSRPAETIVDDIRRNRTSSSRFGEKHVIFD